MHVVFTPKGQKLRDPEFGTNLIRYIFEQGDLFTFENIKDEVSMAIKKYAHGITINDISILESGDDLSKIFVRIDYSVMNGLKTINDSIVTQI
jgi:phage baseplate assembly protein W